MLVFLPATAGAGVVASYLLAGYLLSSLTSITTLAAYYLGHTTGYLSGCRLLTDTGMEYRMDNIAPDTV